MEQPLHNLFTKYLEDRCSDQEILLLLEHFKVAADEQQLSQLILEELSLEETLKNPAAETDKRLNTIYANVKLHIDKDTKPKQIKLWSRIAVAAAVVLTLSFAAYWYVGTYRKTESAATYADVLPGKNSATLTLANGKKIKLSAASDGQLAEEAGIRISKTKNGQLIYKIEDANAAIGQLNTLSTIRGETYQVYLPDGTNVTLNAASSLTYPLNFKTQKTRIVELTGEAYFEVAKDAKHPFIVKTEGQQVLVLGTHFNINAYTNENETRTTLLEGSVAVSANSNSKMLSPGEQSSLNGSQITVTKANTAEVTAWKNGTFDFNGEDIKSIMRQLTRWYDVEVDYKGKVTEELYYAKISRNKNISAVLKALEQAEGVHFKIEGRRITVMQ